MTINDIDSSKINAFSFEDKMIRNRKLISEMIDRDHARILMEMYSHTLNDKEFRLMYETCKTVCDVNTFILNREMCKEMVV